METTQKAQHSYALKSYQVIELMKNSSKTKTTTYKIN